MHDNVLLLLASGSYGLGAGQGAQDGSVLAGGVTQVEVRGGHDPQRRVCLALFLAPLAPRFLARP